MAVDIPFAKMNGAGNKIIVADTRRSDRKVSPQAAIQLAGAPETAFDQLMEISEDRRGQIKLNIFNSDGTMAEDCGNGTRCVAHWIGEREGQSKFEFVTQGGQRPAWFDDDNLIRVDMGQPRFGWQDIPLAEPFEDTRGIELQIGPIDNPVLHTPSVASMGNPHCVFFVEEDPMSYALERFGPLLENHPIFPNRCNIHLAQIIDKQTIKMRAWERGAGLTLACGSGACAVVACAVRKGLSLRDVNVQQPGGELQISWDGRDHIIMTGPAEFEFAGLIDPQTGEVCISSAELSPKEEANGSIGQEQGA